MYLSADDGTTFPKDADIISLANQEMDSMLVPWLLKAREGHLLVPGTISLVSNQNVYTMPSRAAATQLEFVTLVDSSGAPVYPGLVEADLEVAVQYPYTQALYGQPTRYYFQGNSLVLVPTPSGAGLSLQLYYPQRPNQIVPSTSVAKVTATAQVGGNFTVAFDQLPTTATFTGTSSYEVVHANPGFEIVPLGTATNLSSTTLTFPGTLPANINVGDSICLIDTANYPTNVPADVWTGMFAIWVALKIAEIRRDQPGMAALKEAFASSEKTSREYMGRRDKLGHRKVSNASNRVWGRRPLYFVK